MKKYKLIIFIIITSMFILSACNNTKDKYLKEAIHFSTDNVISLKISEGGGKQTQIKDEKKLQEIYSFLNSIKVKAKYEEKTSSNEITIGGGGVYFLIQYKNGESTHIQIFQKENNIKITTSLNNEDLNKYKLFYLSNSINDKEIERFLSWK